MLADVADELSDEPVTVRQGEERRLAGRARLNSASAGSSRVLNIEEVSNLS